MKKIKGILIDVYNKKVEEIEFERSLENFYKLIKCDLVTTAPMDVNNDLVVDDEGLLKNPDHFFSFNDIREPQYAGNGIIIGFNDKGEWISHTMNFETVKKSVVFFQIYKDEYGRSLFIAAERYSDFN